MGRVEERRAWIAHVEDHDPHGLGAAAVVARHFHVRRLYDRLTGPGRYRGATLYLQCKCAFQHVYRHRETMNVERGRLSRLEGRDDDPYLLILALGHAL